MAMIPRRRRLLWMAVVSVAFVGSCTALLHPAARIADPMTHRPVYAGWQGPFPILIVEGRRGIVRLLDHPYASPPLAAGQSFLIPAGLEGTIERDLAEQQRAGLEGGWTLNVTDRGTGRQLVELYWVNDGYSGGAYEATTATVRPLYRKITGPAFAFVFGGIALGLNLLIWATGAFLLRLARVKSRA